MKSSFKRMEVNERFRKYRPPGSFKCGKVSVKLWWKYAYDSIVGEVVRPQREFWYRIWDYRLYFSPGTVILLTCAAVWCH